MSRATLADDKGIRRTVYGVVGAVSLFAGANSYSHIYSLARRVGQDTLSAALLPLSVDGLILGTSLVLLHFAKRGLSAPVLARVLVALGIAATLAANVAYGLAHGPAGALVSAWPAIAVLGMVEMMMLLIRHSASAPVTAPESASAGESTRAVRRERPGKSGASAPGKAAEAEREFAAALAAGALPSIRTIREQMKCGQIVGRRILEHLQGLSADGAMA